MDPLDQSLLIKNLCYLLWEEKSGVVNNWEEEMSKWLDLDLGTTRRVLQEKDTLPKPKLDELVTRFNIDEEQLRFEPQWDRETVWQRNLEWLANAEGTQKKFCQSVGISEGTFSKWKKQGAKSPKSNMLKQIVTSLGLNCQPEDLLNKPFFLSLEPLNDIQRRKWLKERIDQIYSNDLHDLFPSLYKLFK